MNRIILSQIQKKRHQHESNEKINAGTAPLQGESALMSIIFRNFIFLNPVGHLPYTTLLPQPLIRSSDDGANEYVENKVSYDFPLFSLQIYKIRPIFQNNFTFL